MSAEHLPELSSAELQRYARHLVLPEVGQDGQRRLKAARVLLVGVGGLGSPAAMYLAAAGVGCLGVVESDAVEASNLHRQILHGTSAVGQSKIASAEARLHDLNPHVEIVPFEARLTSTNAMDIVRGFDLVVDGSDNFPTRYLVNDACVLSGIPYVYGAIFRFEGQVSVFATPGGPCYRCLFRDPPPPALVPSCAEAGVLGVLPGIVGSLQALEAIKLVLGAGNTLAGRLLLFDALGLEFREVALSKDPECPVCGPTPTVTTLVDYDAFCGVGAPATAAIEISPTELAAARGQGDALTIIDVREPFEWEICHIEGSTLMPLGGLLDRVDELDPDDRIVAVCHTGRRSLRAAAWLRDAGFHKAQSLAGGVDRWAREVEPEMARY